MKKFKVKWWTWNFRGERIVGTHDVEAVSSEIAYAKFHFNYPDYLIEEVKEVN